MKIRPRGRPLFFVHGSLDIARFVVEISTLGIRGGNGSIHSRTQSPPFTRADPYDAYRFRLGGAEGDSVEEWRPAAKW